MSATPDYLLLEEHLLQQTEQHIRTLHDKELRLKQLDAEMELVETALRRSNPQYQETAADELQARLDNAYNDPTQDLLEGEDELLDEDYQNDTEPRVDGNDDQYVEILSPDVKTEQASIYSKSTYKPARSKDVPIKDVPDETRDKRSSKTSRDKSDKGRVDRPTSEHSQRRSRRHADSRKRSRSRSRTRASNEPRRSKESPSRRRTSSRRRSRTPVLKRPKHLSPTLRTRWRTKSGEEFPQRSEKLSKDEETRLLHLSEFFDEICTILGFRIEKDVTKIEGLHEHLLSFSSIPSAFLCGKCEILGESHARSSYHELACYNSLMRRFCQIGILLKPHCEQITQYEALPVFLAKLLIPIIEVIKSEQCRKMYTQSFKSSEKRKSSVEKFEELIRDETKVFWKDQKNTVDSFIFTQTPLTPSDSRSKNTAHSPSKTPSRRDSSSLPPLFSPNGISHIQSPAPCFSYMPSVPMMNVGFAGSFPTFQYPYSPNCSNSFPPVNVPPPFAPTGFPHQPHHFVKDQADINAENFIAQLAKRERRGRSRSRSPSRDRSRRHRNRSRSSSKDRRRRNDERSPKRTAAVPIPPPVQFMSSADPIAPPGVSTPFQSGNHFPHYGIPQYAHPPSMAMPLQPQQQPRPPHHQSVSTTAVSAPPPPGPQTSAGSPIAPQPHNPYTYQPLPNVKRRSEVTKPIADIEDEYDLVFQ